MPYTNEEGGLLNNFAREPKVYQAEPPTDGQKRTYIILGIAAALLVGGLIFVAFAVSNLS
ncbi:ssl1498 family light-harvesting-like protein [Sphaerospermopsis aphanizomenoides BCCUSP55]|uniref:photosystem II assembly protein Psb34 n=1 Tax=Sphaerospermopsis aphanizomenoides TaxID=459663 RepID=UPI000A845439|nr:ssl1498 family light-harvesting-like protein [Sphaerospermopsis aphanizomenoides]MBK1989518.1 ssl1498 family light-harvesting-like protein [Sphaerospermopsis aphanizomenoides BCCUSP55]